MQTNSQFLLLFCSALCGLAMVTSIQSQEIDDEDFLHLGILEYEVSCLPCHGIEGKGDGPLSADLATEPADLTAITRNNGGAFPADDLALIIDGRELMGAHGQREMPVWGERYRSPIPDDSVQIDVEELARLRIEALVHYIEQIQEP